MPGRCVLSWLLLQSLQGKNIHLLCFIIISIIISIINYNNQMSEDEQKRLRVPALLINPPHSRCDTEMEENRKQGRKRHNAAIVTTSQL